MYRTAEEQLHQWFGGNNRKPLVLRGARQVGKSTLVRIFAKEKGLALHEINLERHLYLGTVFRSGDINAIMGELQGLTGEIRDKERSLLFLDEIQAVPEAIQALRYFYEDVPELAVIAAGSLLEFTLSNHSFSMPVGRITYLHIAPVSFNEFLMATDPELHRFYASWKLDDEMPESRHQKLLLHQREYLLVGGMPEAVQAWIDSGLYSQVQDVQRSILDTCIDDFAKYARQSQLARLQRILRSIPANLGCKIKYTHLSRADRAAEVRSVIDLLCKARICTAVFHSDCSGLPLGAGRDDTVFKLLFLDSGLVCLQLGLNAAQLQKMDERTLVNEGPLAEQFVGQELMGMHRGKQAPELYYWLREGRTSNAELDFVISQQNTIIPIEVKAGKSGTLKSLHQFIAHKKVPRAVRFDLNRPATQQLSADGVTCELISLPCYMAGRLVDLL
jgi:predicted AAA+ superfamily ATPase